MNECIRADFAKNVDVGNVINGVIVVTFDTYEVDLPGFPTERSSLAHIVEYHMYIPNHLH